MMWWWSDVKDETMSEDDFFDMLENGICSHFVEYLEIYEAKGYYIPFITTASYLSHPASRKSLSIKDKQVQYPN